MMSATSLVCYDEFVLERRKNVLSSKKEANLTRGIFKGEISEKTRKDLRKKLNVYFEAMYSVGQAYRKKHNIFHAIVTLTLPVKQFHSDNEIKRSCLARFVERVKYMYDVRFYYWVAEKQINGNIHFHLLIDRFIPHEKVRGYWNDLLDKLGYIRMFEEKHGHANPNSTDIQAIRSLAKSSDYVTKYTTKLDQQGGIEGRLHGESDLLRSVKRFKEEVWSELYCELERIVDQGLLREKRGDNYVCYLGDVRKVFKERCPYTYKRYKSHCRQVAASFYEPEALKEQ